MKTKNNCALQYNIKSIQLNILTHTINIIIILIFYYNLGVIGDLLMLAKWQLITISNIVSELLFYKLNFLEEKFTFLKYIKNKIHFMQFNNNDLLS